MSDIILQFTLKELVALMGLAQALYVLVYMLFRPHSLSRSFLPLLFFTLLSLAFLFSAAKSNWQDIIPYYQFYEQLIWMFCIPLNALLVLQIARITTPPSYKYWFILLTVPLSFLLAKGMGGSAVETGKWLDITFVVVGAFCFLLLWIKRNWLEGLRQRRNGRERYWVILALIILNLSLLFVWLLYINQHISQQNAEIIRVILGISFIYIVSTSLFRLYPQIIFIPPEKASDKPGLSEKDIEMAIRIENLLFRQKVYQEASYGRAEMARELGITESSLSRIVNQHFDKTVPTLLNQLRVEDAKQLLRQTTADITTVAGEAGFNSIATFNRVFKGIEGISPSEYREQNR
jgi:AraC-like DNA-binding protein